MLVLHSHLAGAGGWPILHLMSLRDTFSTIDGFTVKTHDADLVLTFWIHKSGLLDAV